MTKPPTGWAFIHWKDTNTGQRYSDSIPEVMVSDFTSKPNVIIEKIIKN